MSEPSSTTEAPATEASASPEAIERYIQDTQEHIGVVAGHLMTVLQALRIRAKTHDDSKLGDPEKTEFARVNDELEETTYGSDEYEALLDELDEALQHHYAHNRHHPEHFADGLAGMHLVDLVEMFADWAAATERHADGDLRESIEKNQERFGYSDLLKSIFHNTAEWLKDHE